PSDLQRVAQAPAERRGGVARRQPGGEKRSAAEGRPRRVAAGERDHGRREVDPEDVVAGPGELRGPDGAPAAEVDAPPGPDAPPPQLGEDPGRRPAREASEADVVDEREIGPVRAAHRARNGWFPPRSRWTTSPTRL